MTTSKDDYTIVTLTGRSIPPFYSTAATNSIARAMERTASTGIRSSIPTSWWRSTYPGDSKAKGGDSKTCIQDVAITAKCVYA